MKGVFFVREMMVGQISHEKGGFRARNEGSDGAVRRSVG